MHTTVLNKQAPERSLQPGWYLYWKHETYHIIALTKEQYLSLHVENDVTSETRHIRYDDLILSMGQDEDSRPIFAPTKERLLQKISNRHSPPVIVPTLEIPETMLARADNIIATVERIEKKLANRQGTLGEEFNYTEELRKICAGPEGEELREILAKGLQPDEPVGLTMYYEYRNLYRTHHGDRGSIAAALRRNTYRQAHLDKAQLHFIDNFIPHYYRAECESRPARVYRLADSGLKFHTQNYWIDPDKCGEKIPQNLLDELMKVLGQELSMQSILNNPEKKALLKKIEIPSRSWFFGYLKWFEANPETGRAVMNSRYGNGTWEKLYMVFDSFAHKATFPRQYVFADHYLLDVFTVDKETRSKLNRLWVTVLIDAYSRSILGMSLLYEDPRIESIQSALYHAIWPKPSYSSLGINEEWICFGIPHQLFLDNAWAHHSHSLENLARALGQGGEYQTIDLVFRPPYKARYGALIESFFGNLSQRIKQELPGAIQSSDPKHLREAKKRACLLYEDIYRYLLQFIVRYQNTPHSALEGMTPNEKWIEGMQANIPIVPPRSPEMQRLFLRMHHDTRQISAKGVSAFDMHYTSAALDSALKLDKEDQPVQYSFRYNPEDISTIVLYQQDEYIGDLEAKELRRPDGSLRPTSLWTLKMAKSLAKANKSEEDWLGYLNEAQQLEKKRRSEQRQIQREAKRLTSDVSEFEETIDSEEELDTLSLDDDEYQTHLLASFES